MEKTVKQPIFRLPVVMLIDDQPLVANRVKNLLKNEQNINFHFCQDPAAAIAQALVIKPTVILLDLVMPKIDGLTLCRLIRDTSELADIPIIMLSANDDAQTKAHSFSSGANDYLVKLPEEIEFIARVRYHSKSYMLKLERDEAYDALCESQIELEAVNKRLQRMAHQDELTQLPNRPLLIDRLAMALAVAKRDKHSVGLLFLDLDNFKPINDTYGHGVGDQALKIVAQRLLSCVRETDTVARLGGDEFAIVLGELRNSRYAAIVAEKVISSISAPLELTSIEGCSLGISIGISIYPEDGNDVDRLLAFADQAMYDSKRRGKNCYTFFERIEQDGSIDKQWLDFKESYLLGIKFMDQQHTEIAHRINHLNLMMNSNEESENIFELFDKLLDEVELHFSAEESLLEENNYPALKEHSDEHLIQLAELRQFKNRFNNNDGAEIVILQHLKKWFLGHLMHADKKAAEFLMEKGVS